MIQKPPKPGDNILETLDQIGDYLNWAQEQVNQNIEVDLAGLDYSIEKACEIMRESDQDIKDQAESKITVIVEQLEKLAEALRSHPMVTDDMERD